MISWFILCNKYYELSHYSNLHFTHTLWNDITAWKYYRCIMPHIVIHSVCTLISKFFVDICSYWSRENKNEYEYLMCFTWHSKKFVHAINSFCWMRGNIGSYANSHRQFFAILQYGQFKVPGAKRYLTSTIQKTTRVSNKLIHYYYLYNTF